MKKQIELTILNCYYKSTLMNVIQIADLRGVSDGCFLGCDECYTDCWLLGSIVGDWDSEGWLLGCKEGALKVVEMSERMERHSKR